MRPDLADLPALEAEVNYVRRTDPAPRVYYVTPPEGEPLSTLASRWVAETLGVPDAKAYVATGQGAREFATTVSLGVGENLEKRVGGSFESDLLRQLPRPVLIDKGAGGEEAARVKN